MLSIALAATLTLSHATPREDLPWCPEPEANVVLSTGEEVVFPVCYQKSQALTYMGFADLEVARDYLAEHNLYPVPRDGRAQMALSAIHHVQSEIGSYKEVLIGIVATSDEDYANSWYWRQTQLLNLHPCSPFPKVSMHIIKLWVDTEMALIVGNEPLGLNKSMAEFELHFDDNKDELSFKMGSPSFVNFVGRANISDLEPLSGGMNLDYYISSRLESGRQIFSRNRTQGEAFEVPFSSNKGDTLHLIGSNGTPTEKLYKALNFEPTKITWAPSSMGQLYMGIEGEPDRTFWQAINPMCWF